MTTSEIVIFGSCLGRDTYTKLEPRGFKLSAYIARQSILSVGIDASSKTLDPSVITSPFQRRMFVGDIRGDALEIISKVFRENPQPVLLWDLVEERCGVLTSPDGKIVTRGVDAVGNGALTKISQAWETQTFGSLTHRLAFMQAAAAFRESLERQNIWEHTYVLAVPWAEISIQGTPTPKSYGFSADHANDIYAEYYEYLKLEGWNIIEAAESPLADDEHKWGLAPFHYEEGVYRALAENIERALNE